MLRTVAIFKSNFLRPIGTDTIIQQIRSRDQKGLTQFYSQFAPAIYGIVLRIVKHEGTAEEVLQETMLKVWDKVELYDPTKGSFFSWACRIARNTALDTARLKGFQHLKKTDTLDPLVHNSRTTSIDTDHLDISTLTADLDPKYQVLLDKVYLEGYSQRDAAKELDLPLGTVKTRIRSAIGLIREKLKNEKNLFFGIGVLMMYIAIQWL